MGINTLEMEKTKLGITNNLILTAGPCIDYREVEYCSDAAVNGWNQHHSDYINRFEKFFKNYIGTSHGFVTSSCTGALHVALKAKGIGPGDEVIVPETTWIATAAAVCYVGATPVFADIKADTWVMDTEKLEKYITPKTKAIMPVHLYGQPVVMEPIWALAEKYNLFILEDAAPSIGTIYKGKKTGSLGHAAAFSFQGAKAVVTGEGGFLLTQDEELFKQAWYFNDHGRDASKALYNTAIGHKYKMSNIQAALGLAQMEKIEEIVTQKRQIFAWYQERLSDIEELALNVEIPDTRNIYWMSSIVLDPKIKFSRDEFMSKLKERKIDSRPMFYPMSSFPMFNSQDQLNKVAYDVPLRGINLPSGHERTEEEIDYVCSHIRDLLDKSSNRTGLIQPSGKLAQRDYIENKIADCKKAINISKYSLALENSQGTLVPVTEADQNPESIKLLAEWREKIQEYFPSQFKVTEEGTGKWLENAVLKTKDRLLFWVVNSKGEKIGHVGLFRFDYKQDFCELDNIARGIDNSDKGIIEAACKKLIEFAKNELKQKDIYLRVFADNSKAVKLYERIGFKEIQRVGLRKIVDENSTKWIDVIKDPYHKIEKYFATMKLS